MNRLTTRGMSLTALAMIPSVGCIHGTNVGEMSQMPSENPRELDRFKMFEGEWVGTAEVKSRGEGAALPMSGSWRAKREFDGWYLVTREEFEIGDSGKTRGMGVWTWDPKRRTYRVSWFGEGGATMRARMKYDQLTNSWMFRSISDGPRGSTIGRGRVTVVGDTMEWSWSEWPAWDLLRLVKTSEMTGNYKRQSRKIGDAPQ